MFQENCIKSESQILILGVCKGFRFLDFDAQSRERNLCGRYEKFSLSVTSKAICGMLLKLVSTCTQNASFMQLVTFATLEHVLKRSLFYTLAPTTQWTMQRKAMLSTSLSKMESCTPSSATRPMILSWLHRATETTLMQSRIPTTIIDGCTGPDLTTAALKIFEQVKSLW